MTKPRNDPAFLARTQPDPATVFPRYLEDCERGERQRVAMQAAYAKHADDYDEARRWWDRIIAAGRAGEFLDANGHSIDLIRSPMQTLRKWLIRDGRPR